MSEKCLVGLKNTDMTMHALGSLGETKFALMATDVAKGLPDGLCEGGLLPLNLFKQSDLGTYLVAV